VQRTFFGHRNVGFRRRGRRGRIILVLLWRGMVFFGQRIGFPLGIDVVVIHGALKVL
jgi:hypothetical protein